MCAGHLSPPQTQTHTVIYLSEFSGDTPQLHPYHPFHRFSCTRISPSLIPSFTAIIAFASASCNALYCLMIYTMACSPSRLLPSSSLLHRCALPSGPSRLWLRNGIQGRWLKRFCSVPCEISPVAPESSSARHRLRLDGRLSSQSRAVSSRTGSSAADAVSAAMTSSEEIDSDRLISSVGIQPTPPVSLKAWNLTDHHLLALSAIACMTGAAVTALFVAAIPTLLAFKKAAESLEKLLDVTQEELPGTMAAVRLSGMEISDLTMELSELGQEISEGVKSSARAVRAAEDGLRRMSNIGPVGPNNSSSKRSKESS